MKAIRLFCLSFFLFPFSVLFAQTTLSGYVTDKETGEALIGATLYNTQAINGTATNRYGYFSMKLPAGENTIKVNYVGYQPEAIVIQTSKDSLVNIRMKSNNYLGEVSVLANKAEQVLRSPEMGMNHLQAKQIEKMPVLLGESDVLKTVQMLPGVNSGSEGMSGISVRGGSPDQTLILLDDVPVYNVNHLFGYFSVFNSQAIHDVNLIKGAIPARYGGRLSSVLDISMKEGNNQKFKAYTSIGTLSAKGTIEGPIVKGKGSYMLSARKTWPDVPLRLYYHYSESEMRIAYGFYDLNGKVNWRFSDNDRVYASFYSGRDAFYNNTDYGSDPNIYKSRFSWGNYTGSVRWNHIFTPTLFANVTTYYSRYGYESMNESTPRDKKATDEYWRESYASMLNDISLKTDFDYRPSEKHSVRFGANLSRKTFHPEITSISNAAADTSIRAANEHNSFVGELYAEDVMDLAPNVKANFGLRSSILYNGEKVIPYLMPRVSLAWKPYDLMSFKVGYSRMVQHVHQLTNSSLAFPTDMWVTSTPKVPSSRSDLYSIGSYFIPNATYSFSVEAYFSNLHDVISYYPGIDYTSLDNKEWSDVIMQGNGRAYGIELTAEKKQGQLTGFASYTYSRSLRSFEEIFDWKYFAYEYDKPHKISALLNYEFYEHTGDKYKKSLGAAFTYSSGRLISMATANYPVIFPPSLDNKENWYSGEVFYTPRPNNYRMRSFHHLDISFQLESLRKNKGSWSFGIYNIYNHFNTSHYNFVKDKIYEVAIFPILPSVTWSMAF